jgi:uncharacterized protein YjbJ (UPF0337 family)
VHHGKTELGDSDELGSALEGKWKQYSGKTKEKWGKLTDDDLTVIHGRRDRLIGKLQERYGIVKQQAEKQVDEFARPSAKMQHKKGCVAVTNRTVTQM